jgi:hypothetical protein
MSQKKNEYGAGSPSYKGRGQVKNLMNILLPSTGNPFLIDKVYLGYSLDILEYRTMDTQSRVQHLPKGHIWAAQVHFRQSKV